MKKIDEIEAVYYDSFNEKLFDIDLDDIQNTINKIKNNIKNRYNVRNTGFAEYDKRNRNGKPKSLLNNYYTKYLLSLYGKEENTEDRTENGLNDLSNKNNIKNLLIKNLNSIEDGLMLYESAETNDSKYQIDGTGIDILAMDKDKNYVIIVLNHGKGYENMVGQLLRNKNWIKKYKAGKAQKARGIIITDKITEDLEMACENLSDIGLYEYELTVKIEKKK
jgi:RecB family endonuclease NucS